jgi:hypothetical protein
MCIFRPEVAACVRPGERFYAVAVATRQARLFVSAARSIVEGSPLLAPLLASATEDELVFSTGHSMPGYYLILPGHEIPDVEQVVQKTATYTIVTKDGTAGER